MTISREDPRFWDTRTLERRMRKGQLTKKDIEKHVKSLPDVADKGQAPNLDAEDDTDDMDDHDGPSNGVSRDVVPTVE
jgi:hypothetical protein